MMANHQRAMREKLTRNSFRIPAMIVFGLGRVGQPAL